jgi:hypothetical protein
LLGLTALQGMPRRAGFAGRTLGRIAADLGLQLDDVDELVGLARAWSALVCVGLAG